VNIANIQSLHNDHDKWLTAIYRWSEELSQFISRLSDIIDIQQDETERKRVIENINTIKHYRRFLKELEEVIKTHEIFLEDISFFYENPEHSDIMMDHNKTRNHLISFKTTFRKIKSNVDKLLVQKMDLQEENP